MQELQLLSDKLDQLIRKYEAVQAENTSLKQTVSNQLKTIETLNGKLANLEDSLQAVQLGKTLSTDKDKESVRKQLDGIIGEIDKILTTLND
jgi:uncharacterized coiled-coil protein SlyX